MRETLAREEARLAEIEIERTRAERRIAELKARLSSALHQAGSAREPVRKAALTNRSFPSTSKEKIGLFLDLFRSEVENASRTVGSTSP